MSQATKGLRVLGASLLAALGVMAFFAVAAQAEEGWLETTEGIPKTITEDLPGHAVIHPLKADGKVHGKLLVPAKKLEILCAKLETKEGKLVAKSSPPLASGTLNFTECETFQNGVLNKGCRPIEPITAKVDGVLKLDAGLTWILISPLGGGTLFTTIKYNTATCALPNNQEVKGEVASECLNEKLETMEEAVGKPDFCLEEMKHHLIQEVSNHALYPGGIKYGESEAFIDGILDVLLATGNPFSGHV